MVKCDNCNKQVDKTVSCLNKRTTKTDFVCKGCYEVSEDY